MLLYAFTFDRHSTAVLKLVERRNDLWRLRPLKICHAPMELRSRIDANGVLNLSVLLGKSDANREVRVTVEPLNETAAPISADQWPKFVHEMAGSIADPTFERHPQGDFEQRVHFDS